MEAITGVLMWGFGVVGVSHECTNTILVDMDILHKVCLKHTISKALSFGIILGSVILKLPQIIKIVGNGSAHGLSTTMYYTEVMAQVFTLCYGLLNNYPFSSFGEAAIITAQNIVIIILIWAYTGAHSMVEMVTVAAVIGGSGYGVYTALPSAYWPALTVVAVVLTNSGRVSQILANYTNKSTGALSGATTFLTLAGCLARVFTSMSDVKDMSLTLGYIASAICMAILLIQIIAYGGSKSAVAAKGAKTRRSKKKD